MTDLTELAKRVEAAKHTDNTLDVLCEIALFEPDSEFIAVRANRAATKVIYTMANGEEKTHWSGDWTITKAERKATAADLRARAAMGEG